MYNKWKIIIVGSFFLFMSCISSEEMAQIDYKNNQNHNARLLANISLKEFNKRTKTTSNVYKGIGIGKIRGPIEEARNEAVNNALFEIAQSYKITISGKRSLIRVTTEVNNEVKSMDMLTDNIKTSSMAIFRDINPLICYDEKNHQFLALIRIEKQKLEAQIRLHDKKAIEKAQYYFEKALYSIRTFNYTQALSNYYSAFYLASQVQTGTVEYYDRRFRKMYNVQIESRQKIDNILKNIFFEDKQNEDKGYVSCRIRVRFAKSYPLSFIPLLVNKVGTITDAKGKIKCKYKGAKKQIEIRVDFPKIRKAASMDLYGFIDTEFSDEAFNKYNQLVLSFEEKDVDVQFYCKNYPELNSSWFSNYSDENIHLMFSKPRLSKKEVQQVLFVPNKFYAQIKPGTLTGEIRLKQQIIAGRILLLGEFKGIYHLGGRTYRKIEINGIKAIGYRMQEAEIKFKKILKTRLIKAIN